MKSIQTEIIIDTPVEKIWKILTDFEKYTEWNPFIKTIKGKPVEGEIIACTLQPPGQKPMVFKPVVLSMKKNQEFRWLGHLFIRGLFDGEHYFRLEKISEHQTKFVHGENFSGILSVIILNMIGENTRNGFISMNKALKERAESIH